MKSDPFLEYILDQLSLVPQVTVRAMFGGYSLYSRGKIFGIIAFGELYCKTHAGNVSLFKQMSESRPFTYTKKDGKTVSMKYWLIPSDIVEDRHALAKIVASVF